MGRLILIFIMSIGVHANAGSSAKICAALFNATSAKITTGAQFLHQKNQTLHTSKHVSLIAQRTQNHTAKQPNQRIDNWLEYLNQTNLKASENPQLLTRLKKAYYKLHVIKHEEVPQSYYDLQVRLARERGHGNIEIDTARKIQLSEVLIKDQQKSLDSWIEYLVSPDSSSYPMWAKFWAFQGMIKLSKFDKETQSFGNRSKGSTSPFIELNREAFAYVIDAVVKKLNKNSLEQITDPKFLSLLEGFNFGKLYARALILSKSGPSTKQLETTEGRWITYPKGSDASFLSRSLEGKNTGWCTAGESTAKSQLSQGDFYVYYSLDPAGKPTIPRVAIRMVDLKIAEVRGIGKNQNLDPHITNSSIVKEKLSEFGTEGNAYQKKSNDMAQLTEIEIKHNKKVDLTKEDIRFLYEINNPIEGFGYQKDPRIAEILKHRNGKKDLAFLFNVKESEVALTLEEALLDHTRYVTNHILVKAIISKHPETIKIVDKVVNINEPTNHFGALPLHLAVQLATPEVVVRIIDKGANVHAESKEGFNALMPAITLGRVEVAKILIERGIDPHKVDYSGRTPLHLAISNGHSFMANMFIELGVNIHARDNEGNTALVQASTKGLTQVVKKLLEKGVNVESKDVKQLTPLLAALSNRHKETSLELIQKGANVHAKDENGNTALEIAFKNNHEEPITIELIKKGADIENRDYRGRTLLLQTLFRSESSASSHLIKRGANVHAKDENGNTALIYAAENGIIEVVRELLQKNVDVNAKSNYGKSALSVTRQKEIHDLLKKHGAKE